MTEPGGKITWQLLTGELRAPLVVRSEYILVPGVTPDSWKKPVSGATVATSTPSLSISTPSIPAPSDQKIDTIPELWEQSSAVTGSGTLVALQVVSELDTPPSEPEIP